MTENKKLKAHLIEIYQTLEETYNPTGLTVGTYNTPVNFNEALRTPIHRWYGYKEGFSPSFVNGFVSKHSKSSEDIIFDPFGGVGTTGLEANKMGHHAYLMDVNVRFILFKLKINRAHHVRMTCRRALPLAACQSRSLTNASLVSMVFVILTKVSDEETPY